MPDEPRFDYIIIGAGSAGCAGWSDADVLPSFRRSEDQQQFPRDPVHGTGGLRTVSEQRSPLALPEAFVQAAAPEQGYPRNPDFNSGGQDGFGLYPATQRSGRRWSTAFATRKTSRATASAGWY